MTPRQAALARLLEDWEAGRLMTEAVAFPPSTLAALNRDGLILVGKTRTMKNCVGLNSAGLAAARALELVALGHKPSLHFAGHTWLVREPPTRARAAGVAVEEGK